MLESSSLPVHIPKGSALEPAKLFSEPASDRPIVYIDRSLIAARYAEITAAFPGVDIHYAMKCNPEKPVLEHVKSLGGHFEIASYRELEMLQAIGVDPTDVLYSNPVKSAREIKLAHA